MLTLQGSFLLASSALATALGIIWHNEALAMLGLTILLWIFIQWLFFEDMRRRMRVFTESIKHSLDRDHAETITLVTDRDIEVEFSMDTRRLSSGYRITLQDTIPDTMLVSGESSAILDSGLRSHRIGSSKLVHRFSVRTAVCGKVEFPGVQVELADHLGFFREEYFAPASQRATILPFLIRPQTTVSVLKHNNLQRHLGHHRHRSSGISSELHGIRDYRAGDPPRTIAWKATARLGKLMTCEFENEVPVRATLLVDLAAYQFEGRPGPTAGDRAISTAASVAKLLLADRDPVAAVLLRDKSSERINHGGGERQLAKLLQYLMVYSNPHPPMDHFYLPDLVQVVFENASRRFPTLFDERYNYGRTHFRWLRWNKGPEDRIRRALAVVLEHLFELPVGFANRMQFDEPQLRKYCLEYVTRYNVVSTATSVAIDPPYKDVGQWLRARNDMTLKMCEYLNQLRSRAKDNELFVIIAPEPHDLLGCEMIEAAVKQVIASGNRVMFIAPERPVIRGIIQDPLAADIIYRHSNGSNRRAASDLGDRLNVIGASFSRIDDPRIMQLVSTEIGILQSATSRSRVVRGARR